MPGMNRTALLLALASIAAACTSAPGADGGAEAPPAAIDVEALDLPYAAAPAPGLVTAGQLSPEQMTALAAAGATHFVSLRLAEENGSGWEEAFAADKGYAFTRIPVAGAAGIEDGNARTLHDLVESTEGTVVVYCGSSNRVGTLLGLGRARFGGLSNEEALEFARLAGMTRMAPVLEKALAGE